MRSDKGGASVELALALPLLTVLILLLVQVGVFVQRQLLVSGAAREAARTAVVASDAEAIRVAHDVAPLHPLDVHINRSDGLVTARLSAPGEFRIAGLAMFTIDARASVVMVSEP